MKRVAGYKTTVLNAGECAGPVKSSCRRFITTAPAGQALVAIIAAHSGKPFGKRTVRPSNGLITVAVRPKEAFEEVS
jgi:hypothetical protein